MTESPIRFTAYPHRQDLAWLVMGVTMFLVLPLSYHVDTGAPMLREWWEWILLGAGLGCLAGLYRAITWQVRYEVDAREVRVRAGPLFLRRESAEPLDRYDRLTAEAARTAAFFGVRTLYLIGLGHRDSGVKDVPLFQHRSRKRAEAQLRALSARFGLPAPELS
jgi:hypothetical protein